MTRQICAYAALIAVFSAGCTGSDADRDGATSPTGMTAHWTLDTVGQDGVTPDATGNGHDAATHGQPAGDGRFGGALFFEGRDQVIDLGDTGIEAPATVSLWLLTNDIFHERMILTQTAGPEDRAGALRFDGTHVEVWDGTAWQPVIDRFYRLHGWMHVAVVYEESGKTTGYLNGGRQLMARAGFDFNGVGAALGAKHFGSGGNVYTGWMDDVRIYPRALGADEIAALHGGT